MRKRLILLIMFLLQSSFLINMQGSGNPKNTDINSMSEWQPKGMIKYIRLYLLEWNTKRKFAVSCDQMKEYYEHYFTIQPHVFNETFIDYSDCIIKLSSGQTEDHYQSHLLNSLVEIKFYNAPIVSICFDIKGNYYFNGTWYEMKDDLYYILFEYFSDVIVPDNVLKKAREGYSGGN